jgi:hypothetical protein
MGIMSGMNIAAALSNTIFGGQALSDTTRVPMTFSSTRRLRMYDPSFKSISTFLSPTESSQGSQLAPGARPGWAVQTGGVGSLFQSVGNGSEQWATENGELPIIEMGVNPNSVSWKQAKRITKRDTQEGSVYFHFTNSKGQNNDILTLDFRGNTGNINLSSSNPNVKNDTGAAKKLLMWHNLWALTREPMLLEDNTINEFMITYSSPVIPVDIMLIGFFSNVLEWVDTAEKPFSRDYSMSFTVQQVSPPLEELVTMVSSINFNEGASTEGLPPELLAK